MTAMAINADLVTDDVGLAVDGVSFSTTLP